MHLICNVKRTISNLFFFNQIKTWNESSIFHAMQQSSLLKINDPKVFLMLTNINNIEEIQ